MSAFQRALHYCSSAIAGLMKGVDVVTEACRVSLRRAEFPTNGDGKSSGHPRQEIPTNGDHLIDAN